jgi:hypothetical protein
MTQKNGTDVLYRHLVMKTLTRGFSLRGASNGWGTDPANQIRGYRNEVRLHGLQGLQPAAAGFVSVAAVSTAAPPTVGCAPV